MGYDPIKLLFIVYIFLYMWFFLAEFGCLNWSSDETRIVYVAEKKLPKCEPFIKRKPVKDADKSSDTCDETTPIVKVIILIIFFVKHRPSCYVLSFTA